MWNDVTINRPINILHSYYSNTWKKTATYNYHLILAILESSVSF